MAYKEDAESASSHNQGTNQALVGDHGHLRGREEPQQLRRMWGVGEVKGEEKWRWDGTAPLKGSWGRGRDPTPEGGYWGTTERAEDQKGVWPGFPCPLGPQAPVEMPGLILCPPRPPPASGS